jgi:hypothetical protein
LGRYGNFKIPRQADPEYVVVFYDEEADEEYAVTLICSCDKNVTGFQNNDEFFYCKHCDQPCRFKKCETCERYNANLETR